MGLISKGTKNKTLLVWTKDSIIFHREHIEPKIYKFKIMSFIDAFVFSKIIIQSPKTYSLNILI